MRPAAVTATGRVTIIAAATTPSTSSGGHDSVKRNTQGARVVNARQGLLFTAASHRVLCPGGVAIIGRALGMELEDDDVFKRTSPRVILTGGDTHAAAAAHLRV